MGNFPLHHPASRDLEKSTTQVILAVLHRLFEQTHCLSLWSWRHQLVLRAASPDSENTWLVFSFSKMSPTWLCYATTWWPILVRLILAGGWFFTGDCDNLHDWSFSGKRDGCLCLNDTSQKFKDVQIHLHLCICTSLKVARLPGKYTCLILVTL